jgi:hypothetical protein
MIITYYKDGIKYNLQENIRKAAGDGSFQALDASYPIAEEFWPDWLKKEVDRYHRYRNSEELRSS